MPEVRLLEVVPRPTAVVAQTTTWEEFPKLWGQLLDEVEVGVLASRSFEPEGRVISSQLPGGEVASTIHRGDYTRLGEAHDAVRYHIAAHGREPAGPKWEIYGHWREDPAEVETEVFWLLR